MEQSQETEQEINFQQNFFQPSTKNRTVLQNFIKTPRTVLKLQKKDQQLILDMKRLVPHIELTSTDPWRLDQLQEMETSKLKQFNQDRMMGLHPRFDAFSLNSALKQKIVIFKQKFVRSLPIDYYQALLYKVNNDWFHKIPGLNLDILCIKRIHHIARLKKLENSFSEIQNEQINRNLSNILNQTPSIYAQYQIFNQVLNLIDMLAIKYKLISLYDYSYRLSDRSLNVKLLDLQEMNKQFFTIETIWLAVMVKKYPLKGIVSDLAKQSAEVLKNVVQKTMDFIGEQNSDCPFDEVQDIMRLVAAKKPSLSKKLDIQPDFDAIVVDYQRLKLKRGFFGYCLRGTDLRTPVTLKSLIFDLEYAYRTFEQEIVGNLLSNIENIA